MYVHVYTSDGYCNAGSLATEGQHQNKRVLAESSAIGQTTPPHMDLNGELYQLFPSVYRLLQYPFHKTLQKLTD